jgi:hypothetical protein
LVDLVRSLSTTDLPTDPDVLRVVAPACQVELRAAELSVQFRALGIENLEFQVGKLRLMQLGRSSERIMRQIEPLELQLEELETAKPRRSRRPRPNGDGRRSANAGSRPANHCPSIFRRTTFSSSRNAMASPFAWTVAPAWPSSRKHQRRPGLCARPLPGDPASGRSTLARDAI